MSLKERRSLAGRDVGREDERRPTVGWCDLGFAADALQT
jgi:hypothetical protein